MKKIITLTIIGFFSFHGVAQNKYKNSFTTSFIRMEKNSQTLYGNFNLKFITGIEYKRLVNKWSFGIKYDHGFNKIKEYPISCADCYIGTGYMREDNIYLTTNYSLLNLANSKLKLLMGLNLYYSNLNFSGEYLGGFSGVGTRKNSTYNTIGLAPSVSIIYYPIERFFISINSNLRFGKSSKLDFYSIIQKQKTNEFVITVPEFKIGVNF